MTRQQADALEALIKAIVDEKIEGAFGRDGMFEYLAARIARDAFDAAFQVTSDG